MSAEYRNMWERIFFLKNNADRIIKRIVKTMNGGMGIFKNRESAIPAQNGMTQ